LQVFFGIGLMPNEMPNRLDGTGPYTYFNSLILSPFFRSGAAGTGRSLADFRDRDTVDNRRLRFSTHFR
jgi:hypothetical protein